MSTHESFNHLYSPVIDSPFNELMGQLLSIRDAHAGKAIFTGNYKELLRNAKSVIDESKESEVKKQQALELLNQVQAIGPPPPSTPNPPGGEKPKDPPVEPPIEN